MTDENPLKIEIARSAIALLRKDGIVVDVQVPGLSLSTLAAERAFEARMRELGWDGPIEIGALGRDPDVPYYAVDRSVWDAGAETAREVRRIMGNMSAAESA